MVLQRTPAFQPAFFCVPWICTARKAAAAFVRRHAFVACSNEKTPAANCRGQRNTNLESEATAPVANHPARQAP
jgi:hypothetical protein